MFVSGQWDCTLLVYHTGFLTLSGLGKPPWNMWLLLNPDCCGELICPRGSTDMILKRYGAHTRSQWCVEKHKGGVNGEDQVIRTKGKAMRNRTKKECGGRLQDNHKIVISISPSVSGRNEKLGRSHICFFFPMRKERVRWPGRQQEK